MAPFFLRMSRALAWWTAELASFLPAALRQAFAGQAGHWRLAFEQGEPVLHQVEAGVSTRLGPLASLDAEVIAAIPSVHVVLPNEHLLIRETSYPQAALPTLSDILSHDAEKLFPFSREAILTGHRIKKSDGQNTLVEVAALPRLHVAELIDRLRASVRDVPLLFEVRAPDGAIIEVHGSGEASVRGQQRPSRRTMIVRSGFGLAALALLGGLLMVGERMNAHSRLAAATEEARRFLPALETRAGRGRAGEALAQRSQGTSVLDTLAAATAAMPDGTYLRSLSISEDDLVLTGQSDDPAPLLALIRDEALLTEAEFAQPVRRRDGESRDDFEISAKIVEARQ